MHIKTFDVVWESGFNSGWNLPVVFMTHCCFVSIRTCSVADVADVNLVVTAPDHQPVPTWLQWVRKSINVWYHWSSSSFSSSSSYWSLLSLWLSFLCISPSVSQISGWLPCGLIIWLQQARLSHPSGHMSFLMPSFSFWWTSPVADFLSQPTRRLQQPHICRISSSSLPIFLLLFLFSPHVLHCFFHFLMSWHPPWTVLSSQNSGTHLIQCIWFQWWKFFLIGLV